MPPFICVTDAKTGTAINIAIAHIAAYFHADLMNPRNQFTESVIALVSNGSFQVRETMSQINAAIAAETTRASNY